MAWVRDRPCVGLNHLEGHLTAVMLELEGVPTPEVPYIGLVASGGHSDLYLVRGMGSTYLWDAHAMTRLARPSTRSPRCSGCPTPAASRSTDGRAGATAEAIDFPRPMWTRKNLDFSFAGLKTAVLQHLHEHGAPAPRRDRLSTMCAPRSRRPSSTCSCSRPSRRPHHRTSTGVVLSGGVACNSELRAQARPRAEQEGVR